MRTFESGGAWARPERVLTDTERRLNQLSIKIEIALDRIHDEALAERVNLSELRRVMTEWHQRAVALGFDGVPDLVASIEAGRPTNTPLRELIETHGEFLEANPYCYFELAYTRRTEWMAWICSKPSADDPNRKVIAQGQGSTPDDAAEAALAHMTPNVKVTGAPAHGD